MVLEKFPDNFCQTREDLITEAVLKGESEFEFVEIKSNYAEHQAQFRVFRDALKIDGVRVNVKAATQQQLADYLCCSLLTPKLADLIWQQASVRLAPCPRPISSTTQSMKEHSQDIDIQLKKYNDNGGLLSTVGKHWVIDEGLKNAGSRKAMNYGWHFEGSNFQGIRGESSVSLAGIRVIQGKGTAHTLDHCDYSQTCVLVARECQVDGKAMDLLDLLGDPVLSYLANETGKLTYLRQSGVDNVNDKLRFVVAY